MGGYGGFPNFDGFIVQCWGSGVEYAASSLNLASNIVVGNNPPYSITDFFAFYPNYAGVPIVLQGTLTQGSTSVTSLSPSAESACLGIGQLVTGTGIPSGTLTAAVGSTTLTLSQAATSSGIVSLSIFVKPLLPIAALNAYISLASASLVQARWLEQWTLAMALYVAHYVTLYLRSQGVISPGTPGAVAAAGLNVGITISKTAGPVSQTLQATPGFDDWGTWGVTTFGQQLATLAKVVGMGPSLVW